MTTASDPNPLRIPRAFMSLDEAAKWLGVSTSTIRRRIASGKLRGYRLPGSRLIFVKVAELEAALDVIPAVRTR
jgi:excisionase family DNA binding protein